MSETSRRTNGSGSGVIADIEASWIDTEVAGCALGDKRLCNRLRQLLQQFEGAMGAPLPLACQDWANAKAAYRFLSNERFGEDAILAGHFQATAGRFAATTGLVLVVQDTTEFSFRWARPETIGAIGRVPIGRVLAQCLLHLPRQAVEAAPHVGGTGGQPDRTPGGSRNHPRSAASIQRGATRPTSSPTRTRMPSGNSISLPQLSERTWWGGVGSGYAITRPDDQRW